MLSGDIGSGKSTILLGVEFALFGLLRSELAGNALLRNGSNEGSVELTFKIEGVEYTIKRTLKRTKKSVEQDAGYLIVNGVKQVATATELKSKILEILGYPSELLTKTKNFVYRYTVYTPQEDMKRILLEDQEQRVAILRKVFDIDKYERITKNASNYAKALRERKRALDAVLGDMESKKKQLADTEKEQQEAQTLVDGLKPQLETARKALEDAKFKLQVVEEKRRLSEEVNRNLQVAKTQLTSKEQQQERVQTDLQTVTVQVMEAQKDIPQRIDTSILQQQMQDMNKQLLDQETSTRALHAKITEVNTLKKTSTETTQKITSLSNCPMCLQVVSSDHKQHILGQEQQKMTEYDSHLEQHTQTIQQAEQEQQQLKTKLEQLRQQENEAALAQLKIKRAEEFQQRKSLLEQQSQQVLQEIGEVTKRFKQLETELVIFQDINTKYEQEKVQLDKIIGEERNLSIQHSTGLERQQNIGKRIQLLTEDIARKEQSKKKLEKTQHVHQWLTDYFVPLMDVIEKHVMAKIHHEFDAVFQDWFSLLIEDTMTARLDASFTPLIQQNGYDIEVANLSGGERTACALAYRLALNKTINSLISTIKTKDILMLDEPTDGFSTEQLDKMRDVLNQLRLKQIVIVSHEQKVESFADTIIRINKVNGVSQIA